MSDIFRRSKHKQGVAAGVSAPVVGYDKPVGGASKDLGAAKGGPSSSFEDPDDKRIREQREEQERIRKEAIEKERAKRAGK